VQSNFKKGKRSKWPMPIKVRLTTRSRMDKMFTPCPDFMQRTLTPVGEARWSGTDRRAFCHPGTRTNLLRSLSSWAISPEHPRVCWISGGAGTGKSTITRTFCDILYREKSVLAGSFFISRQSGRRRNPREIVHTIAYDLAHFHSDYRARLLEILHGDPQIAGGLVKDQVSRLIVEPLTHVKGSLRPFVIVLDAFDECDKDEEGQEGGQLLPLLLDTVDNAEIPMKLLVTSRPEQSILAIIKDHVPAGKMRRVDLQAIPAAEVQADISLYLTEELKRISSRRRLTSWPPPAAVNELVRRTGVLFVYASTVIGFVGDPRYSAQARLSVVFKTSSASSQSTSLYLQLDGLYMQLMYTAVQKRGMTIVYDGTQHPQPRLVDTELCRRLRTVVGSIVLLRDPVSLNTLGDVLWDEDRDEIGITARMLSSVLLVTDDQPIHTLHPSFREFLLDSNRCSDEHFQVNQGERHLHIALGCLLVMNKHLHRNMCDVKDSSLLNSEIGDLHERIDRYVPAAVQYACKHWISHLAAATQRPVSQQGEKWIRQVKAQLSTFCSEHLLHWMEVTSLDNHFQSSLSGLNTAVRWCSVCQVHY
jgi:hypothetical protein